MPPIPPTPINPQDPVHLKWLNSIQGNIVKGHGRKFTRLLFFSFQRTTGKNLNLLREAIEGKLVTSALDQYLQAHSGNKNHPFFSLGFTTSFFRASSLSRPLGPEWIAFLSGMKDRMLDYGKEPETETQWDPAYQNDLHGVWMMAHADYEKLDNMERDVVAVLEKCDATAIKPVENGRRWSDDAGGNLLREPFGFRDGLSQTDFFAPHSATPDSVRIGLNRVLIPEGSHAGGSFLVLRKLDQNVRAFREFETTMSKAYVGKKMPATEPGALLIGRERDGRPLAPHANGDINDFDFAQDNPATRCPFHAHIRKANPRDASATDHDRPHVDALFVRRSVVYDEHGQLPDRSAADYEGRDKIAGGVGLLFMGYMRAIEAQFERLNRQWFNDVDFPFVDTGLGDPIVRGVMGGGSAWTWNGVTVPGLTKFVRSRGGAYFYVPSMDWLNEPVP